MAEPEDPGSAAQQADATAPPRLPRWVKVSAIIIGVLVVLLVVVQLTGVAGDHGPGQHDHGDDPPAEHGP